MWNPFKAIKRTMGTSCLGVDIGTTSMKIAELEAGDRLPRLRNYAILESQGALSRSNRAFQTSNLKMFEREVGEFLKAALDRMQPRTKDAIASIPNFSAFMTLLRFPKMNDAELKQSMVFQAKQYIPLPVSEVAIDWITVGESEDEKGVPVQEVFLIAVEREQIKRYQSVFADAGLTLKVLEVEALSLARSLVGDDPTPTLIVDIGSRATAAVVVAGGQPRLTSQSDFAGASLTQAISESLSINPVRAEELKRERGIVPTTQNYELSTVMAPFLDATIQEAKRAVLQYETQSVSRTVERVVLSGGGANLTGIDKYFARDFLIPVVKAAPLLRTEYPTAIEPLVPALNPLMSVAVGLALREFS